MYVCNFELHTCRVVHVFTDNRELCLVSIIQLTCNVGKYAGHVFLNHSYS